MKAKELRDMTVIELGSKLNELKGELFNLRFQLATGQLDNPVKLRFIRKDIARVKTILNEKQKANA
ncbi:large subunit ribosomal protein L29 [Acetoanaerobium noterae]|jgi:large subunit ribosomal protein L29|uniref:Large ribosomal subunit protein uL29 n=3 Tax=root TaxID=1 RepID=E3PTV6_ACESD|nr:MULTISPECIES: 50S ribosomal protein L29 [Acetoanaerobium]CBH22310.1 50S ribosomal subunit protein L29 [Acetoanaerobium sticklandii]SKB69042.1 large subunit ribosomal protein L29 [Acetoanaerobium noterae]